MALKDLQSRHSVSSFGRKATSNKTTAHPSQPLSSSAYDNAKTAANRAFHKHDRLSCIRTSENIPTQIRQRNKRRHGTGAGSHFVKQRSQDMTRKARKTRSADLPRISRSSCDTPTTDVNLPYDASYVLSPAPEVMGKASGTDSSELSKEKGHQQSPRIKILAKCRSAVSVASLYKAGERPKPIDKLSDRDMQATPSSQASKVQSASPIKRTEGDMLKRARDQYLQEYRSGVVRKKRSIIPVFSRNPREETSNVFSSTAETVCEVVGHDSSVQPVSKLSISEKAKRVSRSFKKKLSKIFQHSSTRKQGMLAQQIDSPYIHFGSGNMTSFRNFSGTHVGGLESNEDYNDLLRRVSPLVLDNNDYDTDARIFSVSDEAVPVPYRSRVTSWNDSSERSTLGQPGGRLLSVVKEQDEICLTPSLHGIQDQEQIFASPQKFAVHFRRSRAESSPPTDIKRLFAAVQRRIQNSEFDGSQINVAGLLEQVENGGDNESATVRVCQSDMKPGQVQCSIFDGSSVIPPRDLVSPSIYSSHSDGDNIRQHRVTPVASYGARYSQEGTAWIDERRSVVKHEFQRYSSPRAETPVMTSNEWRQWSSDEMAALGKQVSSLRLRNYHEPRPLFSGQRLTATSTRQGSDYINRPPETLMNDRFPMIGNGPCKSSTNSSSHSLPILTHGADPAAHLRSKERSALESRPKEEELLSQSTERSNRGPVEHKQAQSQRYSTVTGASNWYGKPAQAQTSMDKPAQARRSVDNVLNETLSPFLDDNVLRAIRKGPYASPSPIPSHNSCAQDSPIKIQKRRQIHREVENMSPQGVSSSKQMVEDFLKSRLEDKENVDQVPTSSPPAYV